MPQFNAVERDEPLTHEEVVANWDDRRLTNMIVPILEHMVGVCEVIRDKAREDRMEETEDHYGAQLHSLDTVIDMLKEWRG